MSFCILVKLQNMRQTDERWRSVNITDTGLSLIHISGKSGELHDLLRDKGDGERPVSKAEAGPYSLRDDPWSCLLYTSRCV